MTKTLLAILLLSCVAASAQVRYRYVTNQLFDIDRSKLWHDYKIEVESIEPGFIVTGRSFQYGTNFKTGYLVKDPSQRVYGTNVYVLNVAKGLSAGDEFHFRAMPFGHTNHANATRVILNMGSESLPYAPAAAKRGAPKVEPLISNELIEVAIEKGGNDEYGTTITGKLTNKGGKAFTGLGIRFGIYDAEDNKVGEAFDFLGTLSPNESWKFKATAFKKGEKYRLNQVTSHQGRLD